MKDNASATLSIFCIQILTSYVFCNIISQNGNCNDDNSEKSEYCTKVDTTMGRLCNKYAESFNAWGRKE